MGQYYPTAYPCILPLADAGHTLPFRSYAMKQVQCAASTQQE